MPRKKRKKLSDSSKEMDLAQEMLYGFRDFAPSDEEPTVPPESTGFERSLAQAYRDGWIKAKESYKRKQAKLLAQQRAMDAPTPLDDRPMTERQKAYLTDLLKEHEVEWEQAQDRLRKAGFANPPELENLIMDQASPLIHWLTTEFPRRQCEALTKKGTRCQNGARLLLPNCSLHTKTETDGT